MISFLFLFILMRGAEDESFNYRKICPFASSQHSAPNYLSVLEYKKRKVIEQRQERDGGKEEKIQVLVCVMERRCNNVRSSLPATGGVCKWCLFLTGSIFECYAPCVTLAKCNPLLHTRKYF